MALQTLCDARSNVFDKRTMRTEEGEACASPPLVHLITEIYSKINHYLVYMDFTPMYKFTQIHNNNNVHTFISIEPINYIRSCFQEVLTFSLVKSCRTFVYINVAIEIAKPQKPVFRFFLC